MKITENLEEGSVPKRLTWVGAEKIGLVGAGKIEATLVLAHLGRAGTLPTMKMPDNTTDTPQPHPTR